MMEMRTARLREGVIAYQINGNTAIVDIAHGHKVLLEGPHLHWLCKFNENRTVFHSAGRFLSGEVDITLLVNNGVLVVKEHGIQGRENGPPSPADPPACRPCGPKLLGIDFSGSEIDSLSNVIEIACFVSDDETRSARERDLFRVFRQVSDSTFSFYKALTEGLWDQYLDRRVLKNIIMKDLGIQEIGRCSRVLDPESFSVCLSTDHGKTAEFIKKFGGRTDERKINLLIFDAHLDYMYFEHESRTAREVTGCNFLCHIENYPFINRIYVLGLRGMRTYPRDLSPKIETFTCRQLRDFSRLVDDLDDTCPYYVSFDLDFLDPSCFGMTNYSVPGGATFIETLELFDVFCGARSIVGLDIAELNASGEPSEGHNDLVLIRDLMISFLGSITFHDRDGCFERVLALNDV